MTRGWTWLALVVLAGCKTDYDLDQDNGPNTSPTDDDDGAIVDGPQPDILVSPEALSFGTKLPDCPTDPSIVTITNVGDLDLEIYDLSLDGNGTSAYTVTGAPTTLMPNESAEVEIVFEASATVAYPATLVIDSNDPDTPRETVDLQGEGGLNATNEDLFFQDTPSSVDVLWVVDDSGSMGDELSRLGSAFGSFIASFVTLGLDYQIAVTTTDMDNPQASGHLRGIGVINPTTAAAAGMTVEEAFIDAVPPQAGGSGSEKALAAAYAALESPGYAVSQGFRRPDANVAVIVVGDEDDQSSQAVSTYVQWMDAIAGAPHKSSISGLIPWDSGFNFDPNNMCMDPLGAPRLRTAIDDTGGIRTDICDLDFDQVLRWLSYTAAGLRAEFVLTDTPLNGAAGMQVYVNGVQVSADPIRIDGWWYARATNSVVFYGDSIPGPGAEVRIVYPVAGTCN